MKKWIFRSLITLLILVIVAIIVLYFSIDGIIRSRVIAAAANSTGQTTTLDSARLSLASGTLTLSGLDVHNPPGFSAPSFVNAKSTVITVQTGSLLSNTIHIPSITIDGLTLTLEQNGLKNNLGDVLAYSRKQSAAAASTTGSGQPGQSRQLDIGKLTLRNVKVIANALGAGTTLDLGTIEMDHPTEANGRLPKIADLTTEILARIAQQIAANPKLPEALRKNLGNVGNVANEVNKVLQSNGKNIPTSLPNFGNLLQKKKDGK